MYTQCQIKTGAPGKNSSTESNGYEAMAEAVKASIEELLIPFHVASDAPESFGNMSMDEFFRKFLVYADKFTGQCCRELSRIFRKVSMVPEVRGTPTLELAKQLRQTVFENLDRTLISYVDSLKRINLDLGGVAQSLSDSSILAETMKGAAIGRVAGGFGNTGKVLGVVGAIAAAGKEASRQLTMMAHQQKLIDDARGLAFSKIFDYLKEVEALPENLLDYCCAKCFGGEIDFSKQVLAVESVDEAIREKVRRALRRVLNLQRIQKEEVAKVELAAAWAAGRGATEKVEAQRKQKELAIILTAMIVFLFLFVAVGRGCAHIN